MRMNELDTALEILWEAIKESAKAAKETPNDLTTANEMWKAKKEVQKALNREMDTVWNEATAKEKRK